MDLIYRSDYRILVASLRILTFSMLSRESSQLRMLQRSGVNYQALWSKFCVEEPLS